MFSIHLCVDRGILVWSLHTIFWQISFHFISFLAITGQHMLPHTTTSKFWKVIRTLSVYQMLSVFMGSISMFRGSNLHVYLLSYSHTGSTNPVWLSVFFTFPGGPFWHLWHLWFNFCPKNKIIAVTSQICPFMVLILMIFQVTIMKN